MVVVAVAVVRYLSLALGVTVDVLAGLMAELMVFLKAVGLAGCLVCSSVVLSA